MVVCNYHLQIVVSFPEKKGGADGSFTVVASGAIISPADNTVLVLERLFDVPRNPSKVELPGGKFKETENSHDKVFKREMAEEFKGALLLVNGVWTVARFNSVVKLDDERVLSIQRAIYPLAGLPPDSIQLIETDSHARAYFLDRDRFLDMASPGVESGNFVSGLETFLWQIFTAMHVRGTIIDALSPGVNLTLHPVILSPGGEHILVNTNKPSSSLQVGGQQHIDDALRSRLAFVFSLGAVQRNLVRWHITMEEVRHTISASFGLVLFSPKVTTQTSLPSGTVWLPRQSSEFGGYVNEHRGFMRKFLKTVGRLPAQDLVGSRRAVSMRGSRTSVRPGPMDK